MLRCLGRLAHVRGLRQSPVRGCHGECVFKGEGPLPRGPGMAVERSLKKGREMRTQLGGQRGLGLGRPQRMPGPRASRASWPGAASSEPVPLTLQNKRFQQAPPKKRKKLLFFAQAFVAEAPRRPFGWASEPGRCHGDRDSRRGPLPGVDLPQLGPEPGGTKKKKRAQSI